MLVGRVGRAHGLDGSFHVASPNPELLVEGMVLEGLGEIVERKGSDHKPLIRVEGIDDRPAAEALSGQEIFVDDSFRPPLEDDEYAAEDLVGCRVADGEDALGDVVRLLGMPSCEVLELDNGMLVPMVKDAIRRIDVEAKRIDVDAGFLGAA